MIKDDQNISVELLIGANCARALEPIKVIPSRNDDPYAMKTVLGWCIVGPVSYRNQSEEKYHGIGQLRWKLEVTRLADTILLWKTN